MTRSDQLWEEFCSGSKEAFLQLYDEYYTLLFSWGCKWSAADTSEVADHLHDFFIYLWERRAHLSTPVQISSYLLTSFKRRLVNAAGQRVHLVPDALYHLDKELSDNTQEEQEALHFAENFQKVMQAMQLLTAAQREVIEMRYLRNMSPQQIADAKKTSLRTVYNLLHRGLARLKEEALKKNFTLLW